MGKGCVSKNLARSWFTALDTKKNGSLSFDEIKEGVEWLADF